MSDEHDEKASAIARRIKGRGMGEHAISQSIAAALREAKARGAAEELDVIVDDLRYAAKQHDDAAETHGSVVSQHAHSGAAALLRSMANFYESGAHHNRAHHPAPARAERRGSNPVVCQAHCCKAHGCKYGYSDSPSRRER